MPADVFTEDGYYAVIPEWVLDAPISAQAVRLYAVLRRYADQRTQHAHPKRTTLAARLQVKSVRTVDSAVAELVALGALETFPRYSEDGDRTSNGYRVLGRPSARGRAADCTTPGAADCTTPVQQTAQQEPQPVEPQPTGRENSQRAARGTRLPDVFPVSEDMKAWAAETAPNVGARDHDEFLDYWRAQPGARGVKVDWVATWRNWMRRANDRPRQQGGGASRVAGVATGTQRAQEAGAALERLLARQDAQTELEA